MSSTNVYIHSTGRLGNQIIRNLAVSIFAEKHNLYVEYSSHDLIKQLGIELFVGENRYEETVELTDDNYFSLYFLSNKYWKYNVDANNHYFQTKEITSFLLHYLRSYSSVVNYMNNNPFNARYNNNNDIYIHVRLGDMTHANVGSKYYLSVIKSIPHDNIFLSTDTTTDPLIYEICSQYPETNVMLFDEISTIQFASTCRHIILSHGTFSAIIGYLSYFSTVHYPAYKNLWHGDVFSVDGWIKHDDYDITPDNQ